MLVGEPPFVDDSPLQFLIDELANPPLRPSWRAPELAVPPALESVVMQALAIQLCRAPGFAGRAERERARRDPNPTAQQAPQLSAMEAPAAALQASPGLPRPWPRTGALLAGRYRLEACIGRGGVAVVYRAVQIDLERPVAVKVLVAPSEGEDQYGERLKREAQILARLRHPNAAQVYDYGVTDGSARSSPWSS